MDMDLLKKRVKEEVKFSYFKDGALWYKTEDGWEFPFPVSEEENPGGLSATLNATEKGILLMRFMRKHMDQEEAWLREAREARGGTSPSQNG